MQQGNNVIFIDDDEHIRNANTQTLKLSGYAVSAYDNATDALKVITEVWSGIVISDIKMPSMDGLTFLEKALKIDKDLPVILITGHGDVAMAVQAMREGAYDFIEKPFSSDVLLEAVRRAHEKRALTLENRSLKNELAEKVSLGPKLIGNTPAMQQLRATIAQIADTDADVLVFGETGAGKEVIARSLHEQSSRKDNNFVAVNCGAIPHELIESELFGHEAGAFTGAKENRIGRFEYANKGTLFLDEIESMPMQAQIHLLRTLQERMVERVGSNKLIPLDIRVVAATKVDLREASDKGEFREDLYYRLNVVTLEIPPLRERMEDIPILFRHLLLLANARYGREEPYPGMNQMRALMSYQWPGNVRELRNIAERYVLLGKSVDYDIARLLHGAESETLMTLPMQVECFEKTLICQQLSLQQGNIKKVMEALGTPRKTLYDKMKKYGIDKDVYK